MQLELIDSNACSWEWRTKKDSVVRFTIIKINSWKMISKECIEEKAVQRLWEKRQPCCPRVFLGGLNCETFVELTEWIAKLSSADLNLLIANNEWIHNIHAMKKGLRTCWNKVDLSLSRLSLQSKDGYEKIVSSLTPGEPHNEHIASWHTLPYMQNTASNAKIFPCRPKARD